jgi:hypothetical protein
MKTAGRHPNTNAATPYSVKQSISTDPDRIIMSISHGQGAGAYYGHSRTAGEYTDFEEVTSSHAYDEIAFQEYADEDPTRLKVSSRRNQDQN